MTGAACIGEPVSWLRLEQLALGELPAPAADAIHAHLGACAVCAACLDRIRADQVALPALPAAAPVPVVAWWKRRVTWAVAGTLAAAAAALVLVVVLRPPGDDATTVADDGAAPTIRLKGDDVLVVGLVRDRAGVTLHAPPTFAPGDRFKLTVTCSQAAEIWVDIVVYQPERAGAPMTASYPGDPVRLTCGNHVALPGAFTIRGGGPASICLAIDIDHPPTRERLGRRKGVACYQLSAEP